MADEEGTILGSEPEIEDATVQIKDRRSKVRAAVLLLLLMALCAMVFIPGVVEAKDKGLIIGNLGTALGMALVYYFRGAGSNGE